MEEKLYFYVFVCAFSSKAFGLKSQHRSFWKQQQSGHHPLLITPFFSSDLYILFDSPDFDLLNIFLSSVLPLHWPLYDSFCFLPRPLPNDPPSSPSQYPESRVVDFSYSGNFRGFQLPERWEL